MKINIQYRSIDNIHTAKKESAIEFTLTLIWTAEFHRQIENTNTVAHGVIFTSIFFYWYATVKNAKSIENNKSSQK